MESIVVSEFDAFTLLVLPVGLGLLGFVEPCSIGSTLVFIKHLESRAAASKLAQVAIFAAARATLTGLLGIAAVALGGSFFGLQRGAWALLGGLYLLMGALFIAGRANLMMMAIGPALARLSPRQSAAGLGFFFGLNIPACAAPLLLALLAAAAAGGAAGLEYAAGFASLALFGLALSAPLVLAVLSAPVRRALDRLASLTRRMPFWTGLALIGLGLWSIRFAYVADLAAG